MFSFLKNKIFKFFKNKNENNLKIILICSYNFNVKNLKELEKKFLLYDLNSSNCSNCRLFIYNHDIFFFENFDIDWKLYNDLFLLTNELIEYKLPNTHFKDVIFFVFSDQELHYEFAGILIEQLSFKKNSLVTKFVIDLKP